MVVDYDAELRRISCMIIGHEDVKTGTRSPGPFLVLRPSATCLAQPSTDSQSLSCDPLGCSDDKSPSSLGRRDRRGLDIVEAGDVEFVFVKPVRPGDAAAQRGTYHIGA